MMNVRHTRRSRERVALCMVWLTASACQTMQQTISPDPNMSFNTASNQNVSPVACQSSPSIDVVTTYPGSMGIRYESSAVRP